MFAITPMCSPNPPRVASAKDIGAAWDRRACYGDGMNWVYVALVVAGCKSPTEDAAAATAPRRVRVQPIPNIALGALPPGWVRTDLDGPGAKLEYVAAVTDPSFPKGKAPFQFELGLYGDYTGEIATGYAERGERFRVVAAIGRKLWFCGGSLYRGGDYDRIAPVRDEIIETAKRICATMRAPSVATTAAR
jgi:hypothetical protein